MISILRLLMWATMLWADYGGVSDGIVSLLGNFEIACEGASSISYTLTGASMDMEFFSMPLPFYLNYRYVCRGTCDCWRVPRVLDLLHRMNICFRISSRDHPLEHQAEKLRAVYTLNCFYKPAGKGGGHFVSFMRNSFLPTLSYVIVAERFSPTAEWRLLSERPCLLEAWRRRYAML